MKRILLALLAALLLAASPAATPPVAAAEIAAQQPATQPRSNAEIRQWYNDQVAVIPALDAQWRQQGLAAEERAHKAHQIRHDARLKARSFMADPTEVADLRARDQEKYGNPDGPDFDYLVARNREKGLVGDQVYEEIVGSSNRTDKTYNDKFGVRPAGQGPP